MDTEGYWWYSPAHRQVVRVLEWRQLWGRTLASVWLPGQHRLLVTDADTLEPLTAQHVPKEGGLSWRAVAARVAESLAQGVLLAPLEGSVIPLPHQLQVLSRALEGERLRFLLADEVGLGKTIEAGLILRELKLRGEIQRILILAPKGLVRQWVLELARHFRETFQGVTPGDLPTLRKLGEATQPLDGEPSSNPWRQLQQVVCPMDSFKPIESRRGWSREQVSAYNQERLGLLLDAGWDLIIVDEAHRLGGSTDEVARFRLGEALAQAAPRLLLLSATPHQGKTDSFLRLMRLLDREAFPVDRSPDPGQVAPFVIRTEKRRAIDAEGQPLFKPRKTRLCPVSWSGLPGISPLQQQLYEEVTTYVREGYNRAVRERRYALGFLMILMQRLVTSSTAAIRTALERRLKTLQERQDRAFVQDALPPGEESWQSELSDPEADAQEQLEEVLNHVPVSQQEARSVEKLLALACRVEAEGADAKALTLLELMRGFQRAEENPELKFLVFTEFVPTQHMLKSFLEAHGYRVACLNGSLSVQEREEAQQAFAGSVQLLLSTDAGGEGLNLQFCHVIFNFDLPWNPMRIEQRIGRVDRIGQSQEVTAVNLVLEDTVEFRVREVLEAKLATILAEFGVDKSSDVLESVEAGASFDQLYAEVLVNPSHADARLEALLADVRARAATLRTHASLLGQAAKASPVLSPEQARAVLNHPLPSWIERLVLGYLAEEGGAWRQAEGLFTLTWPDGVVQTGVFEPGEALRRGVRLFSIQEPRIRRLALELPSWPSGLSIPTTDWPGLAASIRGVFALYRVRIELASRRKVDPRQTQRILPLFLHQDGRVLVPTARHLHEKLIQAVPPLTGVLEDAEAQGLRRQLERLAEVQGEALYRELELQHPPGAGSKGLSKGLDAPRVQSAASIGLVPTGGHTLSPRLEPLLFLKIRS